MTRPISIFHRLKWAKKFINWLKRFFSRPSSKIKADYHGNIIPVAVPKLDQSMPIKLLTNNLNINVNTAYDFFRSVEAICEKLSIDFKLSDEDKGSISDAYRFKRIIYTIQILAVDRMFELVSNQYATGKKLAELYKEQNQYIYVEAPESQKQKEIELKDILIDAVTNKAILKYENTIINGTRANAIMLDEMAAVKDRIIADITRKREVERFKAEGVKASSYAILKNNALSDLSERPENYKQIKAQLQKGTNRFKSYKNGEV